MLVPHSGQVLRRGLRQRLAPRRSFCLCLEVRRFGEAMNLVGKKVNLESRMRLEHPMDWAFPGAGAGSTPSSVGLSTAKYFGSISQFAGYHRLRSVGWWGVQVGFPPEFGGGVDDSIVSKLNTNRNRWHRDGLLEGMKASHAGELKCSLQATILKGVRVKRWVKREYFSALALMMSLS